MTMPRQLLLAKRMYVEALSFCSRSDSVSAGIAISMLQDAVELYIWTVVKAKNIKTNEKNGFVACIKALETATVSVPHSAKLYELNTARVNFKHYGNLPAHEEVVKHRTYAEDFLRDAMREHFSIDFDELSLADLVSDEETRGFLKTAENCVADCSYQDAIIALAKAKWTVFARLAKYIPEVDRTLSYFDQANRAGSGRSNEKPFTYIAGYLHNLREATLAALFRISRDDYRFLQVTLPPIVRTVGGEWQANLPRSHYSKEECQRAIGCIVSIGIQLEVTT